LKEFAMRLHLQFRPALLAATVALACISSSLPVQAEDGDTLSLSYGIYVGGNRVYRINYTAALTPDGYKTSVTMSPKGLGKVFADFKLRMTAAGVLAGGEPQPVDFTMESSRDDDHKKVSMSWPADEIPKADRSFEMSEDRAAAVHQVLDSEMPDPLTAVLRHALHSADKPCTRTLRSYNGAEVYDLVFTFLEHDEIGSSKNAIYSGPAYKCRVVFVPIAGYSEKRMRKHLNDPPTYTLWFANVISPTTATKFLVPVQALGKAGKRTFKIIASEAEMSGRPLTALSQLQD
jgi:hypothetical protein